MKTRERRRRKLERRRVREYIASLVNALIKLLLRLFSFSHLSLSLFLKPNKAWDFNSLAYLSHGSKCFLFIPSSWFFFWFWFRVSLKPFMLKSLEKAESFLFAFMGLPFEITFHGLRCVLFNFMILICLDKRRVLWKFPFLWKSLYFDQQLWLFLNEIDKPSLGLLYSYSVFGFLVNLQRSLCCCCYLVSVMIFL